MSVNNLKKSLRKHASKKRKKANEWFFKTGKGEYGYGDIFIGVSMPDCRTVAHKFQDLSLQDLRKLLQSKIHEERMTTLVILVNKFETGNEQERKQIYRFYLKNYRYVNNWDLVDTSAHKIVGVYLLEYPKEQRILNKYVKSKNLWERRLSVIATFPFIAKGDFTWSLKNAKTLLSDTHDLTHKAVGWMLREVWKKDPALAEKFLLKYYEHLPRTTLRYAIERMDEKKRNRFLKGKFY